MMASTITPIRAPANGGALLQWAPTLIERHTRYSTRDLATAQAHLHGLHESIALRIERSDDFVAYSEALLTMGDLVLTMGCIDARNGYELSFKSGDEYLITIPLQGSGWASTGEMFVEYGRDDIMIVGPSCRVVKHWDGPGAVLTLHVPTRGFDAAVQRLNIAALPDAPITKVGSRRLRSFLRVVDMICRDLQDDMGPSPLLLTAGAAHIQDLLLTLLLQHLSDGEVCEPAADSGMAIPYYVRRAEEFIRANAHRDISVEEVGAAVGVSVRTIQYGFRNYRDTTPMLYLKRVRYDRARSMLQSADLPRRKISDVAAEIGCANISQFSRDYRVLFGESPSQTVSAPRRLVA